MMGCNVVVVVVMIEMGSIKEKNKGKRKAGSPTKAGRY